jgi:hypothetical protein
MVVSLLWGLLSLALSSRGGEGNDGPVDTRLCDRCSEDGRDPPNQLLLFMSCCPFSIVTPARLG